MRTTRIVAIGDTHDYHADFVLDSIRDFSPDILLHTGDFEKRETFNTYRSLVSSFHAVRGDKDSQSVFPDLVDKQVFEEGTVWIGQIHGARSQQRERPSIQANKLLNGLLYYWNGFAEDAVAQFPEELNLLFTGHLHVPFIQRVNDTLVVNPGSIAVNGRKHHLKHPTLAVVEIRNGHINQPQIYRLEEGNAPSPLQVGKYGPIKRQSLFKLNVGCGETWCRADRPVTS